MAQSKRKSLIILALFAVIVILVALSGKSKEQEPKEAAQTETSKKETEEAESEEQEEPEVIDFGNSLDAFQGEWHSTQNSYGVTIISGDTVNFVHTSDMGGKNDVTVFTFYFGYDEDELVVKNQYGQTRYVLEIGSDGLLYVSNYGSDDTRDIYEKYSDNLEIPQETEEPRIGMSADDVKNSTWGYPKKVNKTTTSQGTSEQWVYDYGYIYITNGIVYAIQEQ